MRRLYVTAIALLAAGPHALAQAPAIASGGVENAASNVTLTSIAPQVLIAIKGQNLATSTATASGYPLPTQLGGATVSFSTSSGQVLAPLFYASSTQINAQVPNGIAGTSIVVTTAAGSSAPYNIPLVSGSIPEPIGQLGIFTDDGTGCGQAVAFNIPSDGSPLTPNSPQNSLDPEKDLGLAIYLTGLGGNEFTDRQNGVPWNYNGSDNLVPQLVSLGTSLTLVNFGAPGLTAGSSNLSLTYLGPAPDKVAIDQANVLGQWKGWPQGCRVPLSLALLNPLVSYDLLSQPPVIFSPFTTSQLVNVSIQPGGGVCVDPPDSTLGILTWQTNTVSDVGGVTTSDAVTAQFIQSDGLSFAQPGPLGGAYPLPLPH